MDELVRCTRMRDGKNVVVASWLSAAGFYHRLEFRTPGAVFLVRDAQDGPENSRKATLSLPIRAATATRSRAH